VNPYRTLKSVVRVERVETDRVERRLRRAASVADLRRIAKRRLPGGVFDYIDGGAEDERSLAANEAAFARTTFRPRVLRGIEKIDISTTLLGQQLDYPLVLAPTGFTRIADPQGELAVARAAARAGLPYSLSTMSTRSIEEVRSVSDGRLWFQVYAWRDRGLVTEMIQRAAGVSATCGEGSRCHRRSDLALSSTARFTPVGRCSSCAASRSGSQTSSAETSATVDRR
jgi:L-lactate dehydrogenase (cytochrome)